MPIADFSEQSDPWDNFAREVGAESGSPPEAEEAGPEDSSETLPEGAPSTGGNDDAEAGAESPSERMRA